MIRYTVTVRGALTTGRAPADLVDREMRATLAEIGAIGQRALVQSTPRGVSAGRGGLAGSIFTAPGGTPLQRSQTIASSVFYAPIVELGRRPGKRPPIAPILLWVRRKLGLDGRQARSAAFLIAQKIGRVGYTGTFMFRSTRDVLVPISRRRFDAMAARIARMLGSA